jgi:hypothetical protein
LLLRSGFPALTGYLFPLAYQHSRKHEGKPYDGTYSNWLIKNDNATQGGKTAFQTENNGCMRGGSVLLGHNLQSIPNACRNNAAVKYGNYRA